MLSWVIWEKQLCHIWGKDAFLVMWIMNKNKIEENKFSGQKETQLQVLSPQVSREVNDACNDSQL